MAWTTSGAPTQAALRLRFGALSLLWGLNWLPIKLGSMAMPPSMFAGTRFAASGLLLLLAARLIGESPWPLRPSDGRGMLFRLGLASVLMVTLTYGPMFWGIQFVPSSLAGVVVNASTPLGLLFFSLLFRIESPSRSQILPILLGLLGLGLIFRSSMDLPGGTTSAWGLAAILSGTLFYCLGTLLCQPLMAGRSPLAVGGTINLAGGVCQIAWAAATEPGELAALSALTQPVILGSWVYLLVFSSGIAFALYLNLLKYWSPSRVGAYAFVSPVVAVAVGWLLAEETPSVLDILGMTLMLSSAGLTIWRRFPVDPHRAKKL